MKKVYWTALAAVWAVATGAWTCSAAEAAVVATVNGDSILASDFNKDWQAFVDAQKKAMSPDAMTPAWQKSRKEMLLEKMIEQRLILQAAQKQKIAVKEADIDAAEARVKARFRTDANGQPVGAEAAEAAFKKELASEGLTEKQFRENIANLLRATALTDQIVKEKVKAPSDEQLRKVYAEVKERMIHPSTGPAADDHDAEINALAHDLALKSEERVQLQYILFRVDPDADSDKRDAELMQAKQVRAKIEKGANFADMARQYSDDAVSGRNGGEAGYVARGELRDKALADAIFALPVGGISDVLQAPAGYEIVRVEEKRAAADVRFDGVRNYLVDNLERMEARRAWADYVRGLRKDASVAVKTDFSAAAADN